MKSAQNDRSDGAALLPDQVVCDNLRYHTDIWPHCLGMASPETVLDAFFVSEKVSMMDFFED